MKRFILGKKHETLQMFNDDGKRIPVTIVKSESCYLVGIKTQDKHGYYSAVLGFGDMAKPKKQRAGELKKAGIKTPLRFLKEVRLTDDMVKVGEKGKQALVLGETTIEIGGKIMPQDMFVVPAMLSVSGRSKGKGFAGVVKRHGFAGGPATHGQSDRHRAPGSIGATTTPGRVLKGKRMAGRMGRVNSTISGLSLVSANEDTLVIKGMLPGRTGSLLLITAK